MLALAAGTVFAGTAAQASVTVLAPSGSILVPVSAPSGTPFSQTGSPGISAAALAADPSLSGYCTYDIQVVVSSVGGTDRFSSMDLRAQLGSGGMYYIPPSNDSNFVQAVATRNAAATAFLQVDTMVMIPSVNSGIGIFGKSAFAPPGVTTPTMPSNGSNFLDPNDPNMTAFEPANDMSLVDAAWTTSVPNNTPTTGTFTVARLTVKNGSTGTFIGRVGSLLTPSSPVSFTYFIGVPEPTSVALLGLGLGAVALRRRK
jgi:hypothetical protein